MPVVPQSDTGPRLLLTLKIDKLEVVGYYYRSVIYANLTKEPHNTERYREGVMQVNAIMF